MDLEITSVFDYYDAPLNGAASLGDKRLYFRWVDDHSIEQDGQTFRVRCYCAWTLSDEEWDTIKRFHAVPLPDYSDECEEAVHMGALNELLETREGVVGFTSNSLHFPAYQDPG